MEDFDALTHVLPTGGKTYCCYGAYADVGCVADCPAKAARRARAALRQSADADSIAWRAYSKCWPEAMCGYEFTRDKSYSLRLSHRVRKPVDPAHVGIPYFGNE